MHGSTDAIDYVWSARQLGPEPRISVIIPTHNRPAMLAEAIASVRAQTFVDYEIIVVSNGEREPAASRRIAQRHGCRFIGLADANRSLARNVAVQHARGEWIALLDDDDLWLADKLLLQVVAAVATGADCVFANVVLRAADGSEREHRIGPRPGLSIPESFMVWRCGSGGCSSVMIRREALLTLGGFDPNMTLVEDWDMWRRVSQRHRIVYLNEILAVCRTHGLNGEQHHYLRPWFCTYWEVYHAIKIIRTCPPELRHMIPGTLRYIAERALLQHWFFVFMGRRSQRPWARRLRNWLRPRRRINALIGYSIFGR